MFRLPECHAYNKAYDIFYAAVTISLEPHSILAAAGLICSGSMSLPPTRIVRYASLTAALSAATLIVSLLIHHAIPSRWLDRSWFYSHGGSEVYTTNGQSSPGTFKYEFTFEPIGTLVHSATRLTITVAQTPRNDSPPDLPASLTAQDAALDRVRIQFTKVCGDLGMPEMANSYDAAWSSPGHTLVFEYPERRTAVIAAWCAAIGLFLSIPVLAVTLLACLWLVPRWLASRRLIRCGRCPHCGYDLTGLPADRCPECGRSKAS